MRFAQRLSTTLLTATVAMSGLIGAFAAAGAADAAPTEAEVVAQYGRTTVAGKRLPITDTRGVGPIPTGFWGGWAYGQAHPNVAPQGANDWNCKAEDGRNPSSWFTAPPRTPTTTGPTWRRP